MRVNFKNSNFTILAAAIVLAASFSYSAQASKNGTEVKSNTFAVGYSYNDEGTPRICSGALIAPQIIATAAHCVLNQNGKYGSDYIFLPPGIPIDAALDPSKVLPKVSKFLLPPNFKNNGGGEADDIAFIFLDTPLAKSGFIKLATDSEIATLNDSSTVSGYGYGANFESHTTYSAFAMKYEFPWSSKKVAPESFNMLDLSSATTVACSGDSGGPITARFANGEEKLVAVLSGTAAIVDRCGGLAGDNLFHIKVTRVTPFLSLVADIYKPELIFATPKPVVKTTKITCIKGKTKKVIVGVKPKCPTGYKKL